MAGSRVATAFVIIASTARVSVLVSAWVGVPLSLALLAAGFKSRATVERWIVRMMAWRLCDVAPSDASSVRTAAEAIARRHFGTDESVQPAVLASRFLDAAIVFAYLVTQVQVVRIAARQ
ncbi:MAG: hypothetical protein K8T90_15950 [Planctomycetes bacterium]|nr:hypothetical protein [Planctomycetota bacterium]